MSNWSLDQTSRAHIELHAGCAEIRGIEGRHAKAVDLHRRREAQITEWWFSERNPCAKEGSNRSVSDSSLRHHASLHTHLRRSPRQRGHRTSVIPLRCLSRSHPPRERPLERSSRATGTTQTSPEGGHSEGWRKGPWRCVPGAIRTRGYKRASTELCPGSAYSPL